MSRVDAVLFQQSPDIRAATTELDEGLERVATASSRQNGVEEALRRRQIKHSRLFEGRKSIRGQHFRPLVAVVTGSITSGEDMTEAVREAAPRGNRRDRHFAADFVENLHDAPAALRGIFRVHPEVEQRELELAHRLQSRMEAAGGDEPCLGFRRQLGAGLEVTGDLVQDIRMPRVVLQNLACHLYRVPGDTVDSCNARVIDSGQHMMEAKAELVKQCQHIVVCQKRGTARARWQEVAYEVGDRKRRPGVEAFAPTALVHPRATALVGPRIGIQVEAPDRLAGSSLDFEEAHVRMPYRGVLALPDAHAEQAFGNFKQARQDLG